MTRSQTARRNQLLDEVLSIRAGIGARFGNDVGRLCDHLQELEEQHADRMASPARLRRLSANRRAGV